MHVRRVSHSWLGIRCKNSSRQQGPVKGPGGGGKPGRRPFLLYSSDAGRGLECQNCLSLLSQAQQNARECSHAGQVSQRKQVLCEATNPSSSFRLRGGKGHSHTTLNRLQAALSRSCNQTLTHMHLCYSRVGGRVPVLCLLGGTHPYLLLRR